MTIVNKQCADCGTNFEYDEKPGYPRKYCFSCSAERKKSYTAKQEAKDDPNAKVPVVKGKWDGEKLVPAVIQQQGKNATMYVSYAKDIFCALTDAIATSGTAQPAEEMMKKAIELVKQARGEFE